MMFDAWDFNYAYAQQKLKLMSGEVRVNYSKAVQ